MLFFDEPPPQVTKQILPIFSLFFSFFFFLPPTHVCALHLHIHLFTSFSYSYYYLFFWLSYGCSPTYLLTVFLIL